MNLLAHPRLLRQICLPAALPAPTLQMANVWVGGELMKNGLHYDNYDNLLHQIRGRKRALIFPPEDTQYLYYGAASIHRHEFGLPGGVSNQTTFEKVRDKARPFPSPPLSIYLSIVARLVGRAQHEPCKGRPIRRARGLGVRHRKGRGVDLAHPVGRWRLDLA